MEKLRPQILLVILMLGGLGGIALLIGEQTAIATGCVTLMGALGMKILEKD